MRDASARRAKAIDRISTAPSALRLAAGALPRLFPVGVEIVFVFRPNGSGCGDRRCRSDETRVSVGLPCPSMTNTHVVYSIGLLLIPLRWPPDTSSGLLTFALAMAYSLKTVLFPYDPLAFDPGIWLDFRDRHLGMKIGSLVPRTGAEEISASRSRGRMGDSSTMSGKRLSAS